MCFFVVRTPTMAYEHRVKLIAVFTFLVAFSSSFTLHKQSAHSGVSEIEEKILYYESIQNFNDAKVGPILERILGPHHELLPVHARRLHKNLTCDTCLDFMGMIDMALGSDTEQDTLNDLVTNICILSGLLTPRVCVMGVKEWAPHGKVNKLISNA